MATVSIDWGDDTVVSFDGPDQLGVVDIVAYCTEHGPPGFLEHQYTTPSPWGENEYDPELTVTQFGRTLQRSWYYYIPMEEPPEEPPPLADQLGLSAKPGRHTARYNFVDY